MKPSQLFYVGVLGFIFALLTACKDEPVAVENIPLVMVAQPSTDLQKVSSYAGEIQARQQTALAFRVGGQITQRYADVGDRVRANQVLAELDVKDAQLQLNSAQAQLDNAQSSAKIAAEEYKRFQQLLPINAVSRSQFDMIKNQHDAAQAQLKQAQANFNVIKNQKDYNQLLANKAGVITARNIEVGQVVAAGQAVYQLAIDGEREVVIGVAEQAVSQLKVGQAAWVSLWHAPEERLNAVVREISPAADQSRTFAVKVAVKDQANLQLGQSARVYFAEQQQAQTVYVPLSSISAQNQKPYVMVLQANNTVRKTPVSIGEYGRDSVSILAGLKPQQWVVIGGVHLLHDQQKIQPIDRDNRQVKLTAAQP